MMALREVTRNQILRDQIGKKIIELLKLSRSGTHEGFYFELT